MEQGLNLIQQLQATPKWGEFEQWYEQQNYSLPFEGYREIDYIIGFDDLDFEFQKGVFEKFIESRGDRLEQEALFDGTVYSIWKDEEYITDGLFENVLIKYFNQ